MNTTFLFPWQLVGLLSATNYTWTSTEKILIGIEPCVSMWTRLLCVLTNRNVLYHSVNKNNFMWEKDSIPVIGQWFPIPHVWRTPTSLPDELKSPVSHICLHVPNVFILIYFKVDVKDNNVLIQLNCRCLGQPGQVCIPINTTWSGRSYYF